MKLVKFKCGKYGVRKLTLAGYFFANKMGEWILRVSNGSCCNTEFDKDEAEEVLATMKARQKRIKDSGTPV
jgi:hypothetical protein